MEFNDTTNNQGLIQMCERESKLGLGVISDNASPDYYLTLFLAKINEWLNIVEFWIGEVNDEVIFDDVNNTGDIPEEFSFTDDTQIYDLDSDITKIRKVEFHDATKDADTCWSTAEYYLQKDRREDLYEEESDSPLYYFIQGRAFITDVPVDTAKVDKYRITYSRHGHEFIVTDTTAEAGFDKVFHPILYYGSVMDWTKDKDIFNKCYAKIFGKGEGDPLSLKFMLQQHYKNQLPNVPNKVGRKLIDYS